MEISVERISVAGKDIFATEKNIDGRKFYALSDIMEQLELKGQMFGIGKSTPIHINADIVWGYVASGNNFIEAVFIDADSARSLINSQTC